MDFVDILEEIEGSEDETDGFVDIRLEEEPGEPAVLLTEQEDSEEDQCSQRGAETEEENEEGDEVEGATNVTDPRCGEESEETKSVSSLTDV